MGLLDFLGRGKRRGTEGGGVDGPIGMGANDAVLDEPGEGGPSVLMPDLAALRWAAQHEAVNVGRMPLEPEQWHGGRMAFEYERHLAHDHEGIRDRLSDFVSANVRDIVADLYTEASHVADIRSDLQAADTELNHQLNNWHAANEDVRHDALEVGRYNRLRSRPYQLGKWLVALALFGAEYAMSVALFDKVIGGDNRAMPYVFATGLILILILVPHFAAIGLKEGMIRYHEAEFDEAEKSGLRVSVHDRRKARTEEIEDKVSRISARAVGLALVVLIGPLSWLRATELGSRDQRWFWFFFFLMAQFAISGYFFIREWWDYGTASHNLKAADEHKHNAQAARSAVFSAYTEAVSGFMTRAQDLTFFYRQAPRWDSYIVECYLGTLHHFRHLLTVQNPELDVFIANATLPYLGTDVDQRHPEGAAGEFDPIDREHTELMVKDDSFSRGWWLKQVNAALIDSIAVHGDEDVAEEKDFDVEPEAPWSFESPERLLAEFLERFFDQTHPYKFPDLLERTTEVEDPADPSNHTPSTPAAADHDVLNLVADRRRGTEKAAD